MSSGIGVQEAGVQIAKETAFFVTRAAMDTAIAIIADFKEQQKTDR